MRYCTVMCNFSKILEKYVFSPRIGEVSNPSFVSGTKIRVKHTMLDRDRICWKSTIKVISLKFRDIFFNKILNFICSIKVINQKHSKLNWKIGE